MRILHLTLKKKWFDMIASGEKKEEYREINNYWTKRFIERDYYKYSNVPDIKMLKSQYFDKTLFYAVMRDFDSVHFANGGHFHPSIPQITLKCAGMEISTGKTEWGAEPGKEYFVIKLGDII